MLLEELVSIAGIAYEKIKVEGRSQMYPIPPQLAVIVLKELSSPAVTSIHSLPIS